MLTNDKSFLLNYKYDQAKCAVDFEQLRRNCRATFCRVGLETVILFSCFTHLLVEKSIHSRCITDPN